MKKRKHMPEEDALLVEIVPNLTEFHTAIHRATVKGHDPARLEQILRTPRGINSLALIETRRVCV